MQGKPRTDVRVTTVYTTEEDRIQGEDINNATKSEILERGEEKINLVSDEDIKDVLQNKMNELKRKQSSLKKDVLLSSMKCVKNSIRLWTMNKKFYLW